MSQGKKSVLLWPQFPDMSPRVLKLKHSWGPTVDGVELTERQVQWA